MNDSEIIGMFFERNQQAIAELEKKYSSALTRTAENILGNRQDAQECVNDAYLGVWNTVPPQEPESLCGYACRIVRNLALKKYHTNTAQKRNSRYDVALDELENCFSGIDSAEGEFDAAQTAGLINSFLGMLDEESRVMFVRRYWYADSVADIARLTGSGEHTVTVRLSRIRGRLRKYLNREGVTV